jgi:2-haloacid dehalogenase
MNKNITTIIFDFGGVLINWDPRHLYRRLFTDLQEMEKFLTDIDFMEWNAHQDKGRPFAEGVQSLSMQFPHYADLIRAYHEQWRESITGQIQGSVDILRALKEKGYPLYGLSNWSNETFPLARDMFPFFTMFDDIILSGKVNLIKPDPAIFEFCLHKIGKPANECLFIDDSSANVAAARQLGFDVVLFTSPEQLTSELEKRKIL